MTGERDCARNAWALYSERAVCRAEETHAGSNLGVGGEKHTQGAVLKGRAHITVTTTPASSPQRHLGAGTVVGHTGTVNINM